jgi:sigma-E factor negative regulatory protein RseC
MVGDRVIITIASGSFIKASLAVYLLPVLALVIGALLGETYSTQIWASASPEMVSVLTGVTCLGVSFGAIRLFSSKLSQNQRYYPVIEEILPTPVPPVKKD